MSTTVLDLRIARMVRRPPELAEGKLRVLEGAAADRTVAEWAAFFEVGPEQVEHACAWLRVSCKPDPTRLGLIAREHRWIALDGKESCANCGTRRAPDTERRACVSPFDMGGAL